MAMKRQALGASKDYLEDNNANKGTDYLEDNNSNKDADDSHDK